MISIYVIVHRKVNKQILSGGVQDFESIERRCVANI